MVLNGGVFGSSMLVKLYKLFSELLENLSCRLMLFIFIGLFIMLLKVICVLLEWKLVCIGKGVFLLCSVSILFIFFVLVNGFLL